MSSSNGTKLNGFTTEETSFREALAQMIRRMTPNTTLREDLLQEALVHLWLMESRRPGQTRSWYLQSCRFHLQHYLSSGRSIDSGKRWRDQLPLNELQDEEDPSLDPGETDNSVLNSVSAREIIALLEPHLSKPEKAVLNCLADGLGAREIGRALNLSHTMVIRHRRKIAALFTRLELTSSSVNPLELLNRTRNSNAQLRFISNGRCSASAAA